MSGTDGVGTKLKVAFAAGRHDSVGIDLVAMCVNDIITRGAEPLFFLDYFATGTLDGEIARDVVAGVAAGCTMAGCALIGGETAEMPSLYAAGEYDLAGFAVGAVERDAMLPRDSIGPGDVILGLASNGLHSNGYSLVRRVVEQAGLDYADSAPFSADETLGDALLTPTRIYVSSCLAAHGSGRLKALAHITGGGLMENLPRVLPDGLAAELDTSAWPRPGVFPWLAETGGISHGDMALTFNCGIGMMAVVAAEDARAISDLFTARGETVYSIGAVTARADGTAAVILNGVDEAWRS